MSQAHNPRAPATKRAIIDSMAQLVVRNIEEEVVRALKLRAAQRGVSAEAEHREILRQALLGDRQPGRFKDALASMPDVGNDEDFSFVRDEDREDGLSA
jgi:antitoxin FitA